MLPPSAVAMSGIGFGDRGGSTETAGEEFPDDSPDGGGIVGAGVGVRLGVGAAVTTVLVSTAPDVGAMVDAGAKTTNQSGLEPKTLGERSSRVRVPRFSPRVKSAEISCGGAGAI